MASTRAPAAPVKRRTRLTPASAVNKSTPTDALAEQLSALDLTAATPTVPRPRATRTAPAPAVPAVSSRRPPPPTLKVASSKPAPVAPASTLSPQAQASEASKRYNTALKVLSDVNKSGWRNSSTTTPPASRAPPVASSPPSAASDAAGLSEKVQRATRECSQALGVIRELINEGLINNRATELEKAAGPFIAHLVQMGMYHLALPELAQMRFAILRWYDSSASLQPPKAASAISASPLTSAHVLFLPLPPTTFFDPPTLTEAISQTTTLRPLAHEIIPLVLLVQQFTLGCLFRMQVTPEDAKRRPEVVSKYLLGDGGPLSWRKLLGGMEIGESGAEMEAIWKRVDGMMTSMFGTVTNGCIGMDLDSPSDILLSLRFEALLFYASSRPLYADEGKLDLFYDQARKVLVIYGRQAERNKLSPTKVNAAVKDVFLRLLQAVQENRGKTQGKYWIDLCEVALRAEDEAMMDQISTLIAPSSSRAGDVDPESRVTSICARISISVTSIDKYCKSSLDVDNTVADHLRRISAAIPLLTPFRSQDLPSLVHAKIDKLLERIRLLVLARIKAVPVKDSDGERLVERTEIEKELFSLVEVLVVHVESATVPSDGKSPSSSGAVDALLALALYVFVVDNRLSFTPAFQYLERCLPLIRVSTTDTSLTVSDLDHHHQLRNLASTYYNLGGAIFNAGKDAESIRFFRRSCEISSAALAVVQTDSECREDSPRNETLASLRKHCARRWELLALAYQSTGERKLAYDAYISCIVNHTTDELEHLSDSCANHGLTTFLTREQALFKVVQRTTKLATFELLLPGQDSSLLKRFHSAGHSVSTIAAVIELQIASLERNLDQLEALNAITGLLHDLLVLYDPLNFPMRRARALVRQMQHSCSPEVARTQASLAVTSEEVIVLCAQKSSGHDEALRSFASEYLALSHLWLAFRAHQDRSCAVTCTEARRTLQILRAAFDGKIPPSPSAHAVSSKIKISTPPAAIVPTRKRAVRAPVKEASSFKTPMPPSRVRLGRSRPTVADQTTPPAQITLDSTQRVSTPRRSTESPIFLLDNYDRCYATLETMANLLGALGYSLLRMSFLRLLRRLSGRSPLNVGAFISASSYLGHEYVRLGKTSRAGLVFAQAEARLATAAAFPAAHVLYYTLYAEYLAVIGNHDRSAQAYADALKANLTVDSTGSTSSNSIVKRTLLLQRSATAANVCSVMYQRKGDLASSLAPAMQALRVWSRALKNIARLSPSASSLPENSATPFTALTTGLNAAGEITDASRKRGPADYSGAQAGLIWELSESFIAATLRVATLHCVRGIPKSAEYYAQQAVDFAKDLGSVRLQARAMLVRVEVLVHKGNTEAALSDLDLICDLLGTDACPEAIVANRLRADLYLRATSLQEADSWRQEAQRILEDFIEAAAEGDPLASLAKGASPGRPTTARFVSPPYHLASPPSNPTALDRVLPSVHASLLRMQIGLLGPGPGNDGERQDLLRRLARLATSDEDHAEELKLRASIQLQGLLKKSVLDVSETVLSIPTFGISVARAGSTPGSKALLPSLKDVDALLQRALALSLSRAAPSQLRELSLLIANLRGLQSSFGKANQHAVGVAATLDLGLAVTLRREMLDAIDAKLLRTSPPEDHLWPVLDAPPSTTASAESSAMINFWATVRERYASETVEATLTEPAFSRLLPVNWTIISIHLTRPDCLLLVRHQNSVEPLIFKLPLGRMAEREQADEEDDFTYGAASEELRTIIEESNALCQGAKNVNDKESRVGWWTERKSLDARLQALMESIETVWLGAFKSVFAAPRSLTPESFSDFKTQVERIMKRTTIVRSQDKKAAEFKIGDTVLRCLSALSPKSEDEDFEDLLHFMVESLQLSGVPMATDETDADQGSVDLRTAIEELQALNPASTSDDEHTFLLLDKSVQAFPWESIACLRGRSVSRLPSLAFLRDRIDLAALNTADDSTSSPAHDFVVDSSKTHFVLNPAGDLKSTQTTFQPWLETMRTKAGWSGTVGKAPREEELKVALSSNDLFLYFGHGGADQYIRSQTIRNLPRCAVAMIWGCSSGFLKDLGDFDPVGTPYHYMVAGCPSLVANLWDVTDRDIDTFSQTVLSKVGLDTITTPSLTTLKGPRNLTQAIAESRDVCHLRYLNGAAPVVYGIPVRFSPVP